MTLRSLRNTSLGLLIACACITGCQRPNRVRVEQPFAPLSQRDMTLTSRWGAWARLGDQNAFLLDFPLPGAVRGFRAFHVFVTTPPGLGTYEIGPGPASAAGFFIQEVGQLSGKAVFTHGNVQVDSVLLKPRQRKLVLDLGGQSGLHVSGTIRLTEDSGELRRFVRRFAGDVAALKAAPTPDDETEPATPEKIRKTQPRSANQPSTDNNTPAAEG